MAPAGPAHTVRAGEGRSGCTGAVGDETRASCPGESAILSADGGCGNVSLVFQVYRFFPESLNLDLFGKFPD